MLLSHLFESLENKHATFVFGRMNPPTLGHKQLMDVAAKQGGTYYIFTSHTQDGKDNPLDYNTKVKFLKAMFPEHAGHIVQNDDLRTPLQVAEWLYKQGYTSITFVAGSDRLPAFKKLLADYNGVEGKNIYYKFNSIDFASSGEREDGAEGVAGVSASGAREAAKLGDYKKFAQSTGAGKLTPHLYDAVRKVITEGVANPMADAYQLGWEHGCYGEQNKCPYSRGSKAYNAYQSGWYEAGIENMKAEFDRLYQEPSDITEDVEPLEPGYYFYEVPDRFAAVKAGLRQTHTGKWHYQVKDPKKYNLSPIQAKLDRMAIERADKLFGGHTFWAAVAEDASGYIPKNKKEANDPRWKTALSVDVKPDTPRKNARAFRLV